MRYAKKGTIYDIDIQTYQAKQCFFCDAFMIPNKKLLDTLVSKSDYKEWIAKYGNYKYHIGNIGSKQICEDCLSDLIDLIKID